MVGEQAGGPGGAVVYMGKGGDFFGLLPVPQAKIAKDDEQNMRSGTDGLSCGERFPNGYHKKISAVIAHRCILRWINGTKTPQAAV